MHPLEEYLRDLRANRFIGVKETSNYPALAALCNAVGKDLKPRVYCVIHPRGQGAGLPDGGFYTQEQFQSSGDAEPLAGQLPARGAVEVKGADENLKALIAGEQVRRYWQRYGLVLVTNLWEFALVGRDAGGAMAALEGYRLAGSEAAFWTAAANPRQLAEAQGERFMEFLNSQTEYL